MKTELKRMEKFPLFSSFQDGMSRRLDNFWHRNFFGGREWSPDIDIAETDNDIIVKAEIPGVDPKEIDISITEDTLTIKGEKKEEKEDKGKSFYCIERSYGRFARSIDLPTQVLSDKVEAKEHRGVLEITLPKMEKAKTKTITVKAD